MNRLMEIRKELDVTQIIVAQHIKKKLSTYVKMEKRGFSDEYFSRVVSFLILQCSNRPTDIKTLGITQKRCADLLGIKKSNLCKYKGDMTHVLEKEYKRRLQFKTELHEMLK